MKLLPISSPAFTPTGSPLAWAAAASVFGVVVGLCAPAVRTNCGSPISAARAGAIADEQDPAAKAADDGDDEDDDEAAYRDALAARAIQENCLICHEANMYMDQRLTPAQWQAEVEKMVSWGSPLPEPNRRPVIDFLARRYRDVDPAPAPRRADLAAIDTPEAPKPDAEGEAAVERGDPAAGERLYKVHCANCHGATALGGDLGPSLVGRAVMNRYAAFDRDVHKGLRRMPAFDKVLDASQRRGVFAWLARLGRDRAEARP
jgi:ubiquinol-cytochrome c reductase cytochrome c subunit